MVPAGGLFIAIMGVGIVVGAHLARPTFKNEPIVIKILSNGIGDFILPLGYKPDSVIDSEVVRFI